MLSLRRRFILYQSLNVVLSLRRGSGTGRHRPSKLCGLYGRNLYVDCAGNRVLKLRLWSICWCDGSHTMLRLRNGTIRRQLGGVKLHVLPLGHVLWWNRRDYDGAVCNMLGGHVLGSGSVGLRELRSG